MKKGDVIVVTSTLMGCGCSEINPGVLGVLISGKKDRDGDYRFQTCPGGCENYVHQAAFELVEESLQEKAKTVFKERATERKYVYLRDLV